jgi:chorismate dehydratase
MTIREKIHKRSCRQGLRRMNLAPRDALTAGGAGKDMNAQARLRVGAVNYLNTRPLVYEFERHAPHAELILDYPSRLADDLAAGRLDVALIPSIEYFREPTYSIISNACIACRGPVLSVKLFSRVEPEAIRTLALDEGSRTSVALVRILLDERHGVRPTLAPLPVEASLADTSADAVLLIGDRAIHSPGGNFRCVWDLGDEWCRWAELPFVFAMWVARAGVETGGLEAALARARDAGLAHLEEIAAREAAPLGLTRPQCLSYLRDNLYFYLGEREQRGLELFYTKAAQLGLAPEGVELGLGNFQTSG